MKEETEFLKELYTEARNKYKPDDIKILFIAEAPSAAIDRYFYFEDVKKADSLFLEIMGVLYPKLKDKYLKSGRDPELKAGLLETFKEDGYWMIHLTEIPTSVADFHPEILLPKLLERLKIYIIKETPIILIKASLFDLCYPVLRSQNYRVSGERIPFPGSGQQGVFRTKFRKALNEYL